MTNLVLVALTALLQTPSLPDSGVASTYAEIVGEVWEGNVKPAGFVNVIVLGTRLGAQTNEQGRFRITRIPAAVIQVRCQAFGYDALTQTIDLKPGESRSLRFVLARPHVDWANVRLNDTLRTRMRRSHEFRVVRLNPHYDPSSQDELWSRSGSHWRITAEASGVPTMWKRQLLTLLDDSRLYWASAAHLRTFCAFSPGVGVRFVGAHDVTDLVICYTCGEFLIQSADGSRQSGRFHRSGATFLDLARRAFPRDSTLSSIDPARYDGLWREVEKGRREDLEARRR